jgi:hypothetical protein
MRFFISLELLLQSSAPSLVSLCGLCGIDLYFGNR